VAVSFIGGGNWRTQRKHKKRTMVEKNYWFNIPFFHLTLLSHILVFAKPIG
jgi:hypothetical protein